MTARARKSVDEAVRHFRASPAHAHVVRDSYLDFDVATSAGRFAASAEFATVQRLLGDRIIGAVVVDLGAGTGIASSAFLHAGATTVYAIEPDSSVEVGQGAIRRLPQAQRIEVVSAFGEAIPLADQSVDIVYARQVLHHTRNLPEVLRECRRVLRPGGAFLATREHVVNDDRQLARFLKKHPMHQLAGGENAYRLSEYEHAIRASGLNLVASLGPWDSVINAFPHARSETDLRFLPAKLMRDRFGALGHAVASLPIVRNLLWSIIRIERPGRMYSFLAVNDDQDSAASAAGSVL